MLLEQPIEVINKLGLHARAADKLVKLCARYDSTIQLCKGAQAVDAKSIMQVLMLAAAQGTRLKLIIDGDDANLALTEIRALFANYFDEGE